MIKRISHEGRKVRIEIVLTVEECDELKELSQEFGISADDLMYCGYRILAGSAGDEDVMADCKNMALARMREARGD